LKFVPDWLGPEDGVIELILGFGFGPLLRIKIKLTFFLDLPPAAPGFKILGTLSFLEFLSAPFALSLAFSFSVFPYT
jgi:hypothetical protein